LQPFREQPTAFSPGRARFIGRESFQLPFVLVIDLVDWLEMKTTLSVRGVFADAFERFGGHASRDSRFRRSNSR